MTLSDSIEPLNTEQPGRQRVLVIRLGALGDLVHLSPAFTALKAAMPLVELHVLTQAAYADLLAMMPDVDRVWLWQPKSKVLGLMQIARFLKALGFDTVINLHPSLKTWLVTQWIRPVQSAVYHKQKLRLKGYAQRTIPRLHAKDDFFLPFQNAFPVLGPLTGLPHLLLPSGEQPLPKQTLPREWRIGLIPGVGGKRGNRAWPEGHYQTLIALLAEREQAIRVILLGGPDEIGLAERLMVSCMSANFDLKTANEAASSSIPPDTLILDNQCGQQSIPGTARLMLSCDVIIGGDTGPLHLAAGLGVPTLGLFGPTAVRRTGQVGMGAVRYLEPPENVTCWPCELAKCPLPGTDYLACVKGISVEAVMLALLDLWAVRTALPVQ